MSFDDVDEITMSSSRMKEERQVEARGELELRREILELDALRTEMEAVVIEPALADCDTGTQCRRRS